MLRSFQCFTLLLICLTIFCSPLYAQKTYTSTSYNFSIEVPERWEKHVMRDSKPEAVVLAPIGFPASNSNATISIFKPIELCEQFDSLECFVDSMKNQLISARKFLELCNDSTLTINEKKVCRLIAKYEHFKSERMEEHYFFCAENKVYMVVFKAINPLYDRLQEDFALALNSFTYEN